MGVEAIADYLELASKRLNLNYYHFEMAIVRKEILICPSGVEFTIQYSQINTATLNYTY